MNQAKALFFPNTQSQFSCIQELGTTLNPNSPNLITKIHPRPYFTTKKILIKYI